MIPSFHRARPKGRRPESARPLDPLDETLEAPKNPPRTPGSGSKASSAALGKPEGYPAAGPLQAPEGS